MGHAGAFGSNEVTRPTSIAIRIIDQAGSAIESDHSASS